MQTWNRNNIVIPKTKDISVNIIDKLIEIRWTNTNFIATICVPHLNKKNTENLDNIRKYENNKNSVIIKTPSYAEALKKLREDIGDKDVGTNILNVKSNKAGKIVILKERTDNKKLKKYFYIYIFIFK